MKRFPEDQLQRLSQAKTIVIETQLSSQARSHSTPIWVVIEDGEVYLRSYRGQAGRWYQEIPAFPFAVVHLNEEHLPVRAMQVTDKATVARVSQALLQKYLTSSYVGCMVRDEIVATTLRLEPASPWYATTPEERKIPEKALECTQETRPYIKSKIS